MVVLLDTGVLLRLIQRSDPMHMTLRAAVRALKARGDSLTMAPQNAAEFWNVCTRPASARGGFGLSISQTAKRLRILERIVHILPDTPAAYPIWKQLVTSLSISGVQVHDARLVALMHAHGVTHLLTLNSSDFARFTGIATVDPVTLLASTSP